MDNAKIMKELNTFDPSDLDYFPLNELYKRALPKGIRKITSVWPMQDHNWRINTEETIKQNAARFQAEILNARFDGDAEKYELVQRIGRFWIAVEKIRFMGDRFNFDGLYYILNFITGGSVPDKRPIAFIDDIEKNTDRPMFGNTWAWKRVAEVNGHSFTLQGFKNGTVKIKGMTPEMLAEIVKLQVICDKNG